MGHEFRMDKQIDVDATPEQIWDAIATGPGIDSWFMGRSEIEPGEGGATRLTMLGQTESSTITAWQPGRRFAHRHQRRPRRHVHGLRVPHRGARGREHVPRLVQSGVLGDNWETEYEAMQAGWPMYLETLVAYLTHFTGRTATPVTAIAPGAGDGEQVWPAISARFGLTGTVSLGAPARLTAPGIAVDGVVDCVSLPHYFGVRTTDALYRFIHSGRDRGNAVVIGHHIFAEVDRAAAEQAWQTWLSEVFAKPGA